MYYFWLVVFCWYVLTAASRVEEYVEEIEEFIAKAANWTPPVDSSEFENNGNLTEGFGGVFDFIVVGGGSAGCVVASRLSEIEEWKVLLLEAGGEESNITDIPGMQEYTFSSDYNWGFITEPETKVCSGTTCEYIRGKGLGGTSIINGMFYGRGNKLDYDLWESLGNPGWSYKDALPYFKKSEDSHVPFIDPGYHGKFGPLNVERVRFHDTLSKVFLEANVEVGGKILDYNGRNQLGFSLHQFTTRSGKRFTAANAFLRRSFKRPNLKIITKALVTKVLIDRESKSAYGVNYVHNGTIYTAKAIKEVIVSGGAVSSPQILLLSGIGPKEDLENVGIETIADLPVGRNFQDRLSFQGLQFSTNLTEPPTNLTRSVEEYLEGRGRLTTGIYSLQAVGYIKTNYSQGRPDIEYLYGSFNNNGNISIIISLLGLHPKSKGSIKLKSSNPFDFPVITLNMLSVPEDGEILLAGIKAGQALANTEAFKKYNISVIPISECANEGFLSDDYWKCTYLDYAGPGSHAMGSCKMGPANDPTSVVDPRLRIYGVKNLRVADVSIVPSPTSSHTNAVAYLIGEKVSDFIKKDYLK